MAHVQKNQGRVTQRYTATQLRALLARVGVRNDHELVGQGKHPFIKYRKADHSLGGTGGPAWQVITPGYANDPDGQFRDGYNKTFRGATHSEKDPQLGAARKWAEDTYGVFTWAKTPFGSYASEAHLRHRFAELLPEQFGAWAATPDEPVQEEATRRFKVIVYLNQQKPERPVWVEATSHELAREQFTRLLVRVGGTRVLEGLRVYTYDEDA